MKFFVGTSGYSYPKWKGSFYPTKLPQKEMLAYYAEHYATVELNNTFRRLPNEGSFESWASQVPATFRFALKAPQAITQFKRLKNSEEPTAQLFHTAAVLKKRLGPVLFQLPPNFKKDIPRLKAFLRLIPRKAQAAFEFRHESWFDDEVYDCLRAKKCAICTADTDEMPTTKIVSTASRGYVRLRREKYTNKALSNWVKGIQAQPWKEVYVFFKHEDTGAGPKFATRFLELVRTSR